MRFKETEIGKIPFDWEVVTIENALEEIIDYRGKTPAKSETGIVTLSAKSVKNGYIDYSKAYYISELIYQKFMVRGFPQKGDILLTTEAPLGLVAKLNREKVAIAQRLLTLRGKKEYLSNDYLMYYFMSDEGQHQLKSRQSGTTVTGIKQKEFRKCLISIPPFEEQKAIAHILSTLDEKIEVNNQINKTLENIAQTIFKQWFVDFEFPNGAGEPYKSSGGEMVESELGMIPKGWEVKKLEDIIDLHDSKRIPLSKNEREKRDNIYPYYGAASLMDYVDEYIFDGVYVLLGEDGTVITPSGQPILQYVWGKFWVNNHAHVLTGLNNISTNFIYILLKNINVSGAVTGAVQLKINQKNLKEIKIVLPKNNDLISNYSNLLDKSFKKLRLISDENKVLIELRDSLLPKLMSGEIRVPIEEN